MGDNLYLDTRSKMDEPIPFTKAIVKGIAPGGGLLVPQNIPDLTLEEILSLAAMPYHERAAFIYKKFGTDLPDQTIDELMKVAYGDNFDDERIAPITEVAKGKHVMELWHGPTSAFKDMALQCLPVFFSKAIETMRASGEEDSDYLILVATSGDTGKAALEGFRDRDHVKIMVFYPDGGVSDIQYKQMATQLGGNVKVLGGHGNFDDCQTSVKKTFNDAEFNKRLNAKGIKLSSANSINWGRLLPQIVYYVSAYSQMVADGSVESGKPIDICVPTGNFGNILGAYYAKCMGVPIGKLICASNENRVLTDFIYTGVYDISSRHLVLTPSPSMDILVSSNLERQLFELSGRDGEKVSKWMNQLMTDGRFGVDAMTLFQIQELFSAGSATNDESLATIKSVFDEYGYLLDPHTAVAWTVASQIETSNPLLIVSTAHWAKFGYDVYRALNSMPADSKLPDEVSNLSGIELNRLISERTGGQRIPKNLDILDKMELRFTDVCDATEEGVEAEVEKFIG